MFTRCPGCSAVYKVQAQHLRQAMGMVRCSRCATVFNALAGLTDLDDSLAARPIGDQLKFASVGDRIVLDGKSVAALRQREDAVGRKATASPPARASQASAPEPPETPFSERDAAEGARPGRASTRASLTSQPMLSGLLLALRNLLRHRRRTAFGLMAVGFGVVALLLAGGFMEWVFWAMREATIQSRLGHIQVVKEGYFREGGSRPMEFLLPEGDPILAALERTPHVQAVARRMAFSGLISFGDTSVSFLGEGVEPGKEDAVSRQLTIIEGEALADNAPRGIVVGAGLAENLGIRTGESIILMAATQTGGVNAVEAQVRGIFRTSTKAFDDAFLRVPLAMSQELVRAEGAHTWVVLLDDTSRTTSVLAALRSGIVPDSAGYELVPWTDLADFYNKTVVLFSRQVNVVRLIIAVIILVSISNTLIMAVLERTGEIGTLMALGLRRTKVLGLFVNEGFLLGVIGGGAGLLLGLALAHGISAVGIPMPPPPGMDMAFIGEIRVTWTLALGTFWLAVGATALASLYPAWKASRMQIVDALRHAR